MEEEVGSDFCGAAEEFHLPAMSFSDSLFGAHLLTTTWHRRIHRCFHAEFHSATDLRIVKQPRILSSLYDDLSFNCILANSCRRSRIPVAFECRSKTIWLKIVP